MVFEDCRDKVGIALSEDVMERHFDLRDGVVSAEAWVKTMEWEGSGKYLMAERKAWKVKGVLAGYVHKWGSFSNTAVLEAGHLVPTDQAVHSNI
ncbi:hypothetical protein NC651_024466 [Populus alba x Populus x berolinensis]|nr:hypothetical protein NC651_024466 [Populus alba x Populus x berolinensis]